MDSSNKKSSDNSNNTAQTVSYNPWNLIFSPRNRTESESSVSSINSKAQNCQSGPQFGSLQRQTSKNEEYLWMIHQLPSSMLTSKVRKRYHHTTTPRHFTTIRQSASMAANLLSLRLLSALLLAVSADPAPGRIPKVYNALITSNQNLEPSKSYPVYQPVLHDPLGFAVHPSVLYGGEFPFGNGIVPQPAPPKDTDEPAAPPPAPPVATDVPPAEPPTKESNAPIEPPSRASPTDADSSTLPPPPPNTESPIPLNEFGLPSQVLPLGRINPAYNGFTQLGPYAYSYPGVRLYDPYDPFSLSPYGFPFYPHVPNVLSPRLGPNFVGPSLGVPNYGAPPGIPLVPAQAPAPAPAAAPANPSAESPPNEPSDLNVLNYSSKDPAIPNVPPPPLPQGGLKSDKSE